MTQAHVKRSFHLDSEKDWKMLLNEKRFLTRASNQSKSPYQLSIIKGFVTQHTVDRGITTLCGKMYITAQREFLLDSGAKEGFWHGIVAFILHKSYST